LQLSRLEKSNKTSPKLEAQPRKPQKANSSKTTPTNHSSDRKLDQANKKHARSKKRQAYIADEDSASDISSECDDSENDTDALVEVCHLSKESIRMAIPSEWLADTGGSSHMSDQPLLFRNFERINKRIIKVGGGVMYCNHKGTVDVVCKDGSKMTLANVLYIPGLGVNLLSGRRICEAGLTGQFTKSHMYFKCGKNKIITAIMQDLGE
jgi:hypothetical protein